jgi:hypothetical protein
MKAGICVEDAASFVTRKEEVKSYWVRTTLHSGCHKPKREAKAPLPLKLKFFPDWLNYIPRVVW